jgi:hypothetical protein
MNKAIVKGIVLSLMLGLLLLATPVHAISDDFYAAEVHLKGSMKLEWYYNETSEFYEIYVEKSFLAMIPTDIPPGEYGARFEGYADVEQNMIEFYGIVQTEKGDFKAEFTVANEWPQIPTGKCKATGEIYVTIQKTELPSIQYTWVHVAGRVTYYGSVSSFGWLTAHAKISGFENITKAHVCWIPYLTQLPSKQLQNPVNYTFTFYAARLIDTTIVQLNYNGYDFYIAGLWTVINVTCKYYGENFEDYEEYKSIIIQNSTGELKVYNGWQDFTVSINGFNDVKGKVVFSRISSLRISECDVNYDGKVDIADLVHVARCIGSTPGCVMGSFELSKFTEFVSVDFNFDFKINVYDLVSVATEIET